MKEKKLLRRVLCTIAAIVMMALISSVIPSISSVTTVQAATKVKLNKTKVTMSVGNTVNLKVSGTSKKVTWKSSDKKIATVSSKGVVTAKKKGTAKITATVDGKKYTCKVKVEKPSISDSEDAITVGETLSLEMYGTTQKVTWTSDDKSVAKVSKKGVVTGVSEGTTNIVATVGGEKYTCEIIVDNPSISDTKATITVGETLSLEMYGTRRVVIWLSDDERIAKVDENGVVTGVSAGTTTIRALVGVKNNTCEVTVKETYGSVSGNISYFYNNYQGNKPDTGAEVYLISKSGTANSMPVMSSYVEWAYMDNYQQYGVYKTKVDGSGNYKFNHVPTGQYIIVIKSKKTTSGSAFNDVNNYITTIAGAVNSYINNENAQFLGQYCGYQKVRIDSIDIYEGEDTYFSYDFGTTYI